MCVSLDHLPHSHPLPPLPHGGKKRGEGFILFTYINIFVKIQNALADQSTVQYMSMDLIKVLNYHILEFFLSSFLFSARYIYTVVQNKLKVWWPDATLF